MSDYIEREAAIAAAFSANGIGNSQYRNVCDIAERLRLIPAADVVPMDFHERCLQEEIKKRLALERKHGKWIFGIDEETGETDIYAWTCSLCRGKYPWQPNYCPNCGAQMDGDSDV